MNSKFLPLPSMLCPAAAPYIFSLCRQNPLFYFYPRTLSFRHTPSRRRNFFTLSTAASDPTSNSTTAAGDQGEEDSTSIDANNRKSSGSRTSRQTSSTLNIRYRSRSKNRARQLREEEGEGNNTNQLQPRQPLPPKSWDEMTLGEKAVELYMGDKGVLFWLNKFAYASIFIVIGGWILFRFVGPTLNLYQLDRPPLSPSDVLKGSSPP